MSNTDARDAVIVGYGRSAIARAAKGALRNTHPADYAAQVLRGVLQRVPGLDTAQIEDLVLGCAKPEGVQGSNIGRVVAQRAGLPDSVAGQTVNRYCASGLQAIANAACSIAAGQSDLLLAGGVESMTAIPMGTPPEYREPWVDHNTDLYQSMGLTAERVAAERGVSRRAMEEFAAHSHAKAAAAQDSGAFERELVPVTVRDEEGVEQRFCRDEGVRREVSLDKLATLPPAFREDGAVTAATASQVSDGAAFVVMMSAARAQTLGIRPLARFVGYAVAGLPAGVMGLGPIYAVPRVMERTGLRIEQMDVIELNEAFAAQAIPCIESLRLPAERVNPRGGAIALGHPLGATGAILTCKALSYLEDTGGRYALISMCVGGGMGAAGILETL